MDTNANLKDQLRILREKVDKLSEEMIEGDIKNLNIAPPQAMVMREIIQIAKFTSKNARRYSGDWMLTCILMNIRSPDMYKFIMKNEILPLPCVRTIKQRMSGINIQCGFDPRFFEALKKKNGRENRKTKIWVVSL